MALNIPENKKSCALIYKCRLCGAVFSPKQMTYAAEEVILAAASTFVSAALKISVHLLTMHVCEDNRLGLADLIGVENAKTVKSSEGVSNVRD